MQQYLINFKTFLSVTFFIDNDTEQSKIVTVPFANVC